MNAVLGFLGLFIFTTVDFDSSPFVSVLIVLLFVMLVIERRSRRNENSKLWKEVHRGN